MGNQQSAARGGEEKASKEKEKKVNRRVSTPAFSYGKSSVADPSASSASATAQSISQQHVHKLALREKLQASHSPEATKSANAVIRSNSQGSSKSEKKDVPQPSKAQTVPAPAPVGPMDVPTMSKSKQDDFDDATFHPHYTPVSQMRPPRLPLPITDAQVATIPDSPTLGPVRTGIEDVSFMDAYEPVSPHEQRLRRKDSMLSYTTQDDEEVGELQPYAVDNNGGKTVPVHVAWNHGGDKVYVTGTFANWEAKVKLYKSQSVEGIANPERMSATLDLPPGTHHLKFIVDGDMKTTNDLPTAVDYTNVLVNYLEISPESVPKSRRESDRSGSRPIPKSAHPPLMLPEDNESDSEVETPSAEERDSGELPEEEIPLGDFRQLMPQALIDMDLPEDSPKYQQAINVIGDVQGPPSLPLFLGRSILNGLLPMKDDSSVLSLPNHTVLNHLATSSIKNGVLATSVTTRYRKKYVTTIMYKPTAFC